MRVDVIKTAIYLFGEASCQSGTGYEGQITLCEVDGVRCYVLEAFEPAGGIESFCVPSNARVGIYEGSSYGKRECLILVAPRAADWKRLAAIVGSADALGRKVVGHRGWTMRRAAWTLEQAAAR